MLRKMVVEILFTQGPDYKVKEMAQLGQRLANMDCGCSRANKIGYI